MAGLIGSPAWKAGMAKLYGLGAAVVILGAMFKIMHWPGAGPMLVVGLSTEVVIFIFSAFEPLHEDIDWSLVYPELAGMHGVEEGEEEEVIEEEVEDEVPITQQLDNMLVDANIGPELIESLGAGLRSLGDQAEKLSTVTDASVATKDYTTQLKTAADNVGEMSNSYTKATESLNDKIYSLSDSYSDAANTLSGLNISGADSDDFTSELKKATGNLSALNSSYELQLQDSNENLKKSAEFYEGIADLMGNLNESVEGTKKYKEQISELSTNLESLNTVYGNMLNAMRVS
jgi:methyl-accepting chemotaxis protein